MLRAYTVNVRNQGNLKLKPRKCVLNVCVSKPLIHALNVVVRHAHVERRVLTQIPALNALSWRTHVERRDRSILGVCALSAPPR